MKNKIENKIGKITGKVFDIVSNIMVYGLPFLLACGNEPVHQKPNLETKVIQEFRISDANNISTNDVNYVIGDSNAASYLNYKQNYREVE